MKKLRIFGIINKIEQENILVDGEAKMGNYRNEIEQFIYKMCYQPIWDSVSTYIYHHPYALDLSFSRIKYPGYALLEDMVLEYTTNIRINGDILSFEAIVSCTLIMTDEKNNGYTCDMSQWLVVSCEATITDKLDSFKVQNIKPYKSNHRQNHKGQLVSSNIVPIIYKKDLDTVAAEFLSEYYPEALEKPMPVPIADIAEKMGLTLLQGYRISTNFSIFGEICFSEGTLEAYDLFESKTFSLDVHRGTILIDAYTFWERNLGCVKNTIAHEVFHWYRHRMYAAIRQILRKEKLIACRCPTEIAYPSKGSRWSDEQRMEWQANNMAPRILMPLSTFRQKVNELYAKFDYEEAPDKQQVLTNVAKELASFYGVSRQSAVIRMIETGYPEASSVYQHNQKTNLHSYISRDNAFYLYSQNFSFRKLINSGLFIYVDGRFVINDEKYVMQDDDGHNFLTSYAWANLSECTLQFTWKPSSVDRKKFSELSEAVFLRANAEGKISAFDQGQNKEVIEMSEELRQKREEFEKQKAIKDMTVLNKTCWQLIYEIIQAKGLSKSHFCALTNLGEEVYRKAEKNVDTKPSVRTIVAIARGLDLSLETTNLLMHLAGRDFTDEFEDQALQFCITGYQGKSIDEANEFLKSYGYEPLGSKQRI